MQSTSFFLTLPVLASALLNWNKIPVLCNPTSLETVLKRENLWEGREDVGVAFDGRCGGENANVVVKHEGLCRAIEPPL